MANSKKEENPWSETICLPETKFPMRAELAKREPEIIQYWKDNQVYSRLLEKRKKDNKGTFILHDGPPYANGNFHVGHALNKILKDIIVKYETLQGKYAPFVPGWDCHGLPIEHAVVKKLSNKKSKDAKNPVAIRRKCREYAEEYLRIQAEDQTRFGVFWNSAALDEGLKDKPTSMYYTMSANYEAKTLEVFRDLFAKQLIYKGKKPVHWCCFLGTAHAEAEIEYQDHVSDSIYVKFPVKNEENTYIVIWTTTPWTLPANLGLSFHPEFKYNIYETAKGKLILAEGLEEAFFEACELDFSKKIEISSDEIATLEARHPFIDRESKILFGNHVTLEAGTGVVHTAPGHGQDDYQVGLKYGLEPLSPVDDYGKYTDEFEPLKGMRIFDANPKIIEWLIEKGLLLKHSKFTHSYPHSWRSHKPLIMRATPQWFLSIDPLSEKAKTATEKTEWVPDWGEDRFSSMVRNRPDWCLSRQRHWGVPIPEFVCTECNSHNISVELLNYVIDEVKEEGIEIWFNKEPGELLPDGYQCTECGAKEFTRGQNILDVWFDSGISWYAVLMANEDLSFPADMYLEGSDQHRGWFQSSLWPSLALNNEPPFKKVLTHGYVLDEKGHAMSKSLGNVISPVQDIISKYGADILRLWVSSEDYRTDNTIGFDMLKQIADSYRKFRNTFRYILGNLKDAVSTKENNITQDVDKWALHELSVLGEKLKESYETNEYHHIYHESLHFCTVVLSNEYFDIIRDRLYCDANPQDESIDSDRRKSAMATLRVILDHLLVWLAPVLSFTTEEIMRLYKPERSVFQKIWPDASRFKNEAIAEKFKKIMDVKHQVNVQIEEARKKETVKSSQEIKVQLPQAIFDNLDSSLEDLSDYFIASETEVGSEKIEIEKLKQEKCPRCWMYTELTSSGLCERCTKVVKVAS